jgi:hypothetical protein
MQLAPTTRSFSLEPCLLSTGLLKSEFNGDHRSRFIIGYIPSFSKQKSSADQRRELVHKRFWIQRSRLPQVSFNPLATVSQGSNGPSSSGRATWDQIKRACVLVMGAVLGDGKAMTCCVAG